MTFEILGKTRDQRSDANVVYCKCSIDEYLKIIGTDFENFSIQRKKESHKAYQRLKDDLREGALLPSITLAVKHHEVAKVEKLLNSPVALGEALSKTGIVDILDGLQRTYIISELKESGVEFKEGQEVLLEYWLQPEMSKLIYRMIVLNAGQKAMSMRHQIELLFMSLSETISEKIPGLEIIVEREGKKRTRANKYSLGSLASAYQAFMAKSTELDKTNIVAQELSRENVLDSSEEELTSRFNDFIKYLKEVKEIDELAWKYYENAFESCSDRFDELSKIEEKERSAEQQEELNQIKAIKQGHKWLGSDNALLGLFCAIATLAGTKKASRVDTALKQLKSDLENEKFDPLGMVVWDKLRAGINPRKFNVGFATRKLILDAFREYFREDGDTPMSECWTMAAE